MYIIYFDYRHRKRLNVGFHAAKSGARHVFDGEEWQEDVEARACVDWMACLLVVLGTQAQHPL